MNSCVRSSSERPTWLLSVSLEVRNSICLFVQLGLLLSQLSSQPMSLSSVGLSSTLRLDMLGDIFLANSSAMAQRHLCDL